METDQTSPENPDKAATSDEEGGTNYTQTRFYECTFCKRGFSNAQALGGHMNIHRRDKAKLKQPSPAGPPNISKLDSSLSPNPPDTTLDTKWPPWFLQNKDKDIVKESDKVGEIRQLPLFMENPSLGSSDNQKGLSSSQGSSELDLELRLGPDQPSSETAPNTRKFF
ncbi:hypothetical protein SLE2022_195650 [Rubroshorea leprosula]